MFIVPNFTNSGVRRQTKFQCVGSSVTVIIGRNSVVGKKHDASRTAANK